MKQLLLILTLCLNWVSAHATEPGELPSNETALGVVMTNGNTKTNTISLGQTNRYKNDLNRYLFQIHYLRTADHGKEQALLWGGLFRFEREISGEWSAYLGESLTSDIYQGIQQRYSTDAGAKYYLRKNENLRWLVEAGYRFNIENYSYGQSTLNFARLYHEIEQKIDASFSAMWGIEFLPGIDSWAQYQANTELALALSISEFFSLKSAYRVRYNHQPPLGVTDQTDQTFTTSLVSRF